MRQQSLGRETSNTGKPVAKLRATPHQHNSKYVFAPSHTVPIGSKAEGGTRDRAARSAPNFSHPLVSQKKIYILLPLQQPPTISILGSVSPFLQSFISLFYLLCRDEVSKYKRSDPHQAIKNKSSSSYFLSDSWYANASLALLFSHETFIISVIWL